MSVLNILRDSAYSSRFATQYSAFPTNIAHLAQHRLRVSTLPTPIKPYIVHLFILPTLSSPAAASTAAGKFAHEIVGVPVKGKKGEVIVSIDEEFSKVGAAWRSSVWC